MKKTWGNITHHQQKEYEQNPAYLFKCDYAEGTPIEQLVKEMYKRVKMMVAALAEILVEVEFV